MTPSPRKYELPPNPSRADIRVASFVGVHYTCKKVQFQKSSMLAPRLICWHPALFVGTLPYLLYAWSAVNRETLVAGTHTHQLSL